MGVDLVVPREQRPSPVRANLQEKWPQRDSTGGSVHARTRFHGRVSRVRGGAACTWLRAPARGSGIRSPGWLLLLLCGACSINAAIEAPGPRGGSLAAPDSDPRTSAASPDFMDSHGLPYPGVWHRHVLRQKDGAGRTPMRAREKCTGRPRRMHAGPRGDPRRFWFVSRRDSPSLGLAGPEHIKCNFCPIGSLGELAHTGTEQSLTFAFMFAQMFA